jgi:hypothetical protein
LVFSGDLGDATLLYGINLIIIIWLGTLDNDRAYLGLALIAVFRLSNIALLAFPYQGIYKYFLLYMSMLFPIFLILKRNFFFKGNGIKYRKVKILCTIGTNNRNCPGRN